MRTTVVTTPTGLVVTKQASDDSSRVRLRREIEVLSCLRHPNVVELVRPEACPPIDAGGHGTAEPVLVTRFASRSTLADLPPRTADELADVAESLAQILAELHRRGVAHGALAPEHCLVATGGRLVLCSFGRARPVSDPYDVSAAVDAHRLAEMIRDWREATNANNRGERATLARIDAMARSLSRARPDLRRAVRGRHSDPEHAKPPAPSRPSSEDPTPRRDRRRRRGIRNATIRAVLAAMLAVVALRYEVPTAAASDLDSGLSAAVAAASALRWAIVVVASYVAVVSGLWAVALFARRPTMARRLRRVVPPWLERALVGVTIAGALSSAVNEVAAPVPTPITAAPSVRHAATTTILPDPSLPDLSLPDESPTTSLVTGTVPPAPTAVATLEPITVVEVATSEASRPSAWTVSPGDHFWGIAEQTLAQAWGRVPTDRETTRYWRALIAENRSRLADRHNPDLVYIGQVFELPPTPPA